MSMFPPVIDPLLGGSLNIGPTGLPPLAGQLPPVGQLPFANPLTYQAGGGLASQVPVGVGRQAATSALNLAPQTAARASLASRLPSLPSLPSLALKPGATARTLGWRAGLGGAAGMVGSSLIDQLDIGGQNSNVEQGLQGAAQGAGIGAGIGSVVPGLGTAAGALVGGIGGGAIGVLSNIFGGDGEDEPEPVQIIAKAMQQGGITSEQQEMILQTYETQLALADAAEDPDAARDAALAQAGQMVLGFMQENQAAQLQAPMQAANTLALQTAARDIFEPLAQDITTNASLYAQAMSGIRDDLPASYRAISDATVARELTSADKLANAYRAQAALTPVAQSLTQYQQDNSAYASQLFQQALAQQAAAQTGAGGGGADLNALLQATG